MAPGKSSKRGARGAALEVDRLMTLPTSGALLGALTQTLGAMVKNAKRSTGAAAKRAPAKRSGKTQARSPALKRR